MHTLCSTSHLCRARCVLCSYDGVHYALQIASRNSVGLYDDASLRSLQQRAQLVREMRAAWRLGRWKALQRLVDEVALSLDDVHLTSHIKTAST